MEDIWGRNLVAGDLVLDVDHFYKANLNKKKGDLLHSYGIIVSSSHMFVKKPSRFRLSKCDTVKLYKIEHPIDKEKEVYYILVDAYKIWEQEQFKKQEEMKIKQKQLSSERVQNYQRGSILESKSNNNYKYIYFGYCEFVFQDKTTKHGHLYLRYNTKDIGFLQFQNSCNNIKEEDLYKPILNTLRYTINNEFTTHAVKILKNKSNMFTNVVGQVLIKNKSVYLDDLKGNTLTINFIDEP